MTAIYWGILRPFPKSLEILIETDGRELMRRLLQAHLDERSPGPVAEPVISAQGAAYTHQRTHTRRLTTIFGEVAATRAGYGGRGRSSASIRSTPR
jgi:hypothetical protein